MPTASFGTSGGSGNGGADRIRPHRLGVDRGRRLAWRPAAERGGADGGDGGAIDYSQAGRRRDRGRWRRSGSSRKALAAAAEFAADAFGNAGGTGNAGAIGVRPQRLDLHRGRRLAGRLAADDRRRRWRRDRLCSDRRRHDRWRRRDRRSLRKALAAAADSRRRVRQWRRHGQCGIDRGRSHRFDLHRRRRHRTAHLLQSIGGGNGGNVDYAQVGNIVALGDNSIGLIAQSIGGGGSLDETRSAAPQWSAAAAIPLSSGDRNRRNGDPRRQRVDRCAGPQFDRRIRAKRRARRRRATSR